MSKNIISNQKVEVPTGSSLNDKDYSRIEKYNDKR